MTLSLSPHAPDDLTLTCSLHREDDRRLAGRLRELSARRFTPRLVGLRPDLLFPLPAALVELAALDMRTTPLDRLTAVHDTLNQMETHVGLALRSVGGKQSANEYRSALAMPSAHEEVLLLLGVRVSARPSHLASSLAYMRHFAFGAPPHMRDSLEVLVEATRLAETRGGADGDGGAGSASGAVAADRPGCASGAGGGPAAAGVAALVGRARISRLACFRDFKLCLWTGSV